MTLPLLLMSNGTDLQLDVPGQQFVNPIDWVISDHRQYVPQIGFWVNAIEPHSTKQAVHGGGTFTTSIWLASITLTGRRQLSWPV
jgi:hypothetical protein